MVKEENNYVSYSQNIGVGKGAKMNKASQKKATDLVVDSSDLRIEVASNKAEPMIERKTNFGFAYS